MARQCHFQQAGVTAVEQSEKLQAIHDRHPHVDHQQVDLVLMNQLQSVGGVGRHEDFPRALGHFQH